MSLLVWLPLNGDLKDRGIEGNDLINNGATVNNNGKIGKCYYFDGIDDRLYNKFNLDSEVFSIALWFKASQITSSSQCLISLNSGNTGSAGQQFAFIITTSGVTFHSGGNYTLASYSFNINEWYHLALTSNGTIQTLYINGNEQIEHSVGTVKGDNLTIGARSSNDAGAGTGLAGLSSLLGGLAQIGVIAIGVSLLYTGLTRSKRDLVIINYGNEEYDHKIRPMMKSLLNK